MTNTAVTNDVFASTEQTNVTVAPTVDTTYTGTVAELVGEGKKYKTLEALAASVQYANEHIARLESENKAKREAEQAASADELFKKLTSQTTTPTSVQPSMDDLTKIIEETVSNTKKKEVESNNVSTVTSKLTEHFGSALKANEYLLAKSKELSLSMDYLISIAAKSPTAFYNLVEVTPTKAIVNNGIMTSTINTEGKVDTTGLKIGTKSYYDNMLKTDRKKYFTSQIQNEIQEAGFKGTYFS